MKHLNKILIAFIDKSNLQKSLYFAFYLSYHQLFICFNLTQIEWKNLVKKFANKETLCGTINTNSSEIKIKSEPRKKRLPPLNSKEEKWAKNYAVKYKLYDSPKYKNRVDKDSYDKLDNKIVDKALDVIEDLDLLMKYISSSRFNSYYILKQDLKKRLNNMRKDLFN